MPETIIVYRKLFEVDLGLTAKWKSHFLEIKEDEKLWQEAKAIIEQSDFTNLPPKTKNKKILHLLEYYTISRDDDDEYQLLKEKYNHLVKNDQFIDLTLTYDYEEREPKPIIIEKKLKAKTI